MRDMLAEKVVAMKPSGIRKFFDIVNEMEDAISLGVGEPDFETPWHIRDEGIYSLEKGRTFYTSNSGLKELREEITHILFDQTRRTPIVIPVINEIALNLKPGQKQPATREQAVPFKLPPAPKIPGKVYPDVETLEPRHRGESRGY